MKLQAIGTALGLLGLWVAMGTRDFHLVMLFVLGAVICMAADEIVRAIDRAIPREWNVNVRAPSEDA